eukprot:CAMPEP_0114547322 /NCGR_PEP_ID=MMETSP0114-20121206/4403_1 /TAXON_ID=31324 /ORGANISM="Goniomonas sp, Strain m" /LENGTH=386 /DNA_ID=CAMNT_0001731871 /DNA_START=703 /DNA_END=1863 /DNA_ORIENTATION=-
MSGETSPGGRHVASFSTLSSLDKFFRRNELPSILDSAGLSQVDSEKQAKKMGKRLFKNITRGHLDVIEFQDIAGFFESLDQAEKAFELFADVAASFPISAPGPAVLVRTLKPTRRTVITAARFQRVVKEIFAKRLALSASLRDTRSIIGQVDGILTVIALFFVIIGILVLFGVDVVVFLLPLSSFFLAATFIFGNLTKNIFEGMVFLFNTHPYDVGDRVWVNTGRDTLNMFVTEINILFTVFRQWNGHITYISNSQLANCTIQNINRADNNTEEFRFDLDAKTSDETLNLVEAGLKEYIDSHPGDWCDEFILAIETIINSNKLVLVLWASHRDNWQDSVLRFGRKNKMMLAVRRLLKKYNVSYNLLPQHIVLDDVAPTTPQQKKTV